MSPTKQLMLMAGARGNVSNGWMASAVGEQTGQPLARPNQASRSDLVCGQERPRRCEPNPKRSKILLCTAEAPCLPLRAGPLLPPGTATGVRANQGLPAASEPRRARTLAGAHARGSHAPSTDPVDGDVRRRPKSRTW